MFDESGVYYRHDPVIATAFQCTLSQITTFLDKIKHYFHVALPEKQNRITS